MSTCYASNDTTVQLASTAGSIEAKASSSTLSFIERFKQRLRPVPPVQEEIEPEIAAEPKPARPRKQRYNTTGYHHDKARFNHGEGTMSLEVYKTESKIIARQLGYPQAILDKIDAAKSTVAVTQAMVTGRKGMSDF